MDSPDNITAPYDFDTFLSYSRSDAEIAGRIREALENRGVQVWQDTQIEQPGDVWIGTIEKGLEQSRTTTVLVSPQSMGSTRVTREYRAALTIDRRVIPVLLAKTKLPPFLASLEWVDMRNSHDFDARIPDLAAAIRGERPPFRVLPDSIKEEALCNLRWLWFFPEGLPASVYDCMASSLTPDTQQRRVSNLVSDREEDGTDLTGIEPERYADLERCISNESSLAKDVLERLLSCFANDDPFLSIPPISVAQLRLLRDLLRLFAHRTEDERDELPCDQYVELARQVLRTRLTPEQALPALEISREIEKLGEFDPIDGLARARLLAALGLNLQAAELFQAYLGQNVFEDWDLSVAERAAAVLDWAKAEKDAGRGRQNHAQILDVYSQAIALPGLDDLDRAQLLNNRATQTAIFGVDHDWPSVKADIEKSAEIFREVGDTESYLHTRANFVALSLERKSNAGSLVELAQFTDATQTVSEPSEALFFFFYQKGRLQKRMSPPQWQLAREAYQNAADVAEAAHLTSRSVIAKRWVAHIDYESGAIQIEDYLNQLEHYRQILNKSAGDAWAANTLRHLCFDLCHLHVKGGNQAAAWEAGSQAFELEASRFRAMVIPGTTLGYLAALKCLAGVIPTPNQSAEFVKTNRDVLTRLMGLPSWKQLRWDEVLSWIAKQPEVLDGHSV